MCAADSTPGKLLCWEIVASGRVQGVGYRAFVRYNAAELGINGWVRNEAVGSVRAVLQHRERTVLEQMLELLRVGPPAAVVEGVSVNALSGCTELNGFEVRASV